MRLQRIMTSSFEAIDAGRTIREAAERFRDCDIGMLPVVESGRPIGVVTDRDLTVRAAAVGMKPDATIVRQVMTPHPVHCYLDADLGDVAGLMASRQIRRVLVLDRQERLIGIVSLSDLALSVGSADLTNELLQEISKPATN